MAAKPNMSLKKNPMPAQEPAVRAHNFREVACGYSEEVAIDEAMRCLSCKNMPCVSGCPVNIHIPEFIAKVKEGDFEGAYQIISQTSSLPAVCGRVCPQETQCECKCVRGIKGEPVGIGRLERFVADWHNAHSAEVPAVAPSNGHKRRRRRLRPVRTDLRGRPGQKRLRRVRYLKRFTLPAACWCTAFRSSVCPKTIVAEGSRSAGGDGRRCRDQYGHRQNADDRRAV